MRKNRSAAKAEQVVKAFPDDFPKRIRELKRLVREGKNTGDYLLMGAAYSYLAETYHDMNDLDGILSNAIKAVALLKDSDEYELIVKAYSALSQAYSYRENHHMALISDEIAYEIVRKHRIRDSMRLTILNNLSVGYHEMGDTRKSIRFLNECIRRLRERADEDEDTSELVMYSLNLAEYHKDSGDLETALQILQSLSNWIGRVKFAPLICDYHLRLAILFYRLGDREAGDSHTDTALTLIPENIYPLPIYDDLRQITHYLSLNGDRSRSDAALGLMTAFADNVTGTFEQIIAARTMADYYRNFGDYERASEYYASYEALNNRHMTELKHAQMTLHKTSHNAEVEIRRLKRKMQKNEELVSREPMTKLLNRAALLRASTEFIENAAKRKQKVGAIFIDIDFFKECNDTYGHTKGDEIICEVAGACRKQETANIRFARYGGDEFFGITLGLTDEQVCDVARRISQTIRKADIPHEKNPNGGRITLSIGVVNVAIKDRTDTILEIANYADKAVYYAKRAGKNAIYQITFGDPDDTESESSYVRIDF